MFNFHVLAPFVYVLLSLCQFTFIMQVCYDKYMTKRAAGKSHCPVNYALEIFGDNWSLLIVRDIVFLGKKTYGEFLDSDEHISTNILAQRLKHLETNGILQRSPHPSDKRKEIYELTEKGLDLIPPLLEIAGWGSQHGTATNAPMDFVNYTYAHRDEVFALARETVKKGGSLFVGEDSVVAKLFKK